MKFRYITHGYINGEKMIMLGKHNTHEVVDPDGRPALFIAECFEELPRPMTPEEVLEWVKEVKGKQKETEKVRPLTEFLGVKA